MSQIIFGAELVLAIRKARHVKYIAVGAKAVKLTSEQVLSIAAAQPCQGKVNAKGRLEHVRQIPTLDRIDAGQGWQECYRTTQAPVVQPGLDWLRATSGLHGRVTA